MKREFTLTIIIAVGLLTACTNQKEIMNSWLGSIKQQLIMKWGPPARTADDGAGVEILVYTKKVYIHTWTDILEL